MWKNRITNKVKLLLTPTVSLYWSCTEENVWGVRKLTFNKNIVQDWCIMYIASNKQIIMISTIVCESHNFLTLSYSPTIIKLCSIFYYGDIIRRSLSNLCIFSIETLLSFPLIFRRWLKREGLSLQIYSNNLFLL